MCNGVHYIYSNQFDYYFDTHTHTQAKQGLSNVLDSVPKSGHPRVNDDGHDDDAQQYDD